MPTAHRTLGSVTLGLVSLAFLAGCEVGDLGGDDAAMGGAGGGAPTVAVTTSTSAATTKAATVAQATANTQAAVTTGSPEPFQVDDWLEVAIDDQLNLRAGPSTDDAILDAMYPGSQMRVIAPSGSNGWVNVSYELMGDVLEGWAFAEYVGPAPALPDPDYDPNRAAKVAYMSFAGYNGLSSTGYCLREVGDTMEASDIVPTPPGWHREIGAIQWGEWAKGHPGTLEDMGFKDVGYGVEELPRGAVIVWQRGQCGYHSTYGHIEIVVDAGGDKACSDFCHAVRKDCGDPWVWIPTKI